MLDVIIVGGGPAGLSAALVLGRCRRRVQVFDSGVYRNAASHAMHGFLSRDGMPPAKFLQTAREQLGRYENVSLKRAEVTDARRIEDGFEITLADGSSLRSRKLLVATGVIDHLPPIAGVGQWYGKSLFHCPYCDGWEWRERALAIYGQGEAAMRFALELTGWSRDLIVFSDGPSGMDEKVRARLVMHEIRLEERRIEHLSGDDGLMQAVIMQDGARIPRDAMFFATGQHPASPLAAKLGCNFNEKGAVETGKYEITNIPGLYVAGDASRAVQLVVVAAAEGAEAAFSINTALLKEDLAAEEHRT